MCFVNVQICRSQESEDINRDISGNVFIEKRFPLGAKGLSDFIGSKLQYPSTAIADSIEGTVYVKFFVNSSGYVSDISIDSGIREDLDNECIRVVELMRWDPQKSNERLNKVEVILPLKFDLSQQVKGDNLEYLLTPNPVDEGFVLRIFNSAREYQYVLVDENGKTLKSGYVVANESIRVKTSDLPENTYGLFLISDELGVEKRDSITIKR